jgi:hypothetical protein
MKNQKFFAYRKRLVSNFDFIYPGLQAGTMGLRPFFYAPSKDGLNQAICRGVSSSLEEFKILFNCLPSLMNPRDS